MKTQVRPGPSSVLTINRDSIYLVTDRAGEVHAHAELGLFCRDTRFISHYEFLINGKKWLPVQAIPLNAYANRIYFTSPALESHDEEPFPPDALGFQVERIIEDGLRERLVLYNYTRRARRVRLRIRIDSDFCDLFDLRAHRYISRGARDSYWDSDRHELTICYRNRDFQRQLIYRLINSSGEPHFSNGQILLQIDLPAGGAWRSDNHFRFDVGNMFPGTDSDEPQLATRGEHPIRRWVEQATQVTTTDSGCDSAYRQAVEDIGGLRIRQHQVSSDLWVPAAGVPWFVTLFGRDSLVVSYQSMMVSTALAVGTLTKLAEFQATQDDPYRDAEPGKIMHEIRYGELAYFHRIPHTPYYGTADATIFYLILLSELFRWTGDRKLLEQFRAPAEACLNWIDHYGDRDGDGFQEYKTRSPAGYYNQSWKDAGDAIMYPDGSLVSLPIATCELQGYAYDARLRMAEAFEIMGDAARADRLRRQAADLRARFADKFWLPDHRYVALCLDGDKQAVSTVASNPGHCLWSGILDREHAEAVAKRMFEPDMWTGWGIRTLSADNPAYNPLEYQRGSVWPHDNGIIAHGLHRYGYRDLANRVTQAIFDAAASFELFRLPELFAGFPRDHDPWPVQYRSANVPQAWASASIFHLIRGFLGINPDVPSGKIYIDPALPDSIEDLTVENFSIVDAELKIKFERRGGKTNFEILDYKGKLKIEAGRPPWFGDQ